MPSPIELLLDPISLVIFAMFGGLMLWEAILPARELPRIRFWKTKGVVTFAIFFFLSCISMARYSLYLERKLHTGHKR